jgi:hypothetical protein
MAFELGKDWYLRRQIACARLDAALPANLKNTEIRHK